MLKVSKKARLKQFHNQHKRRMLALAVIALIALVGVVVLRISLAGTFSVSLEPENGNKVGVSDCNDDQASQGKCVQFGSLIDSDTVYTQACANRLALSVSGNVSSGSTKLEEISGVVASRKQNGVYWVHNDSGDSARFFALNASGGLIGTYNLSGSGISAIDYEDIGIGPGPDINKDYLYIADIGDNGSSRGSIKIYRIAEPTANLNGGSQSVSAEGFILKYPDGAHNAESFFVDPRDGFWYIVQKTPNGESKIYKVNGRNLSVGSTTTMIDTGVRFQKGNSKPYQETTASDMSPDGSTIIIRTYPAYYIYDSRNKSVESALSGTPCLGPSISEGQGEAVGFKANSRGYVSISEGKSPKVNNVDMR